MYSNFLASMPMAKTLRATHPGIEKPGSSIVKTTVRRFEDALASVHAGLTHPLVLLQNAAHVAANQPVRRPIGLMRYNPAGCKMENCQIGSCK